MGAGTQQNTEATTGLAGHPVVPGQVILRSVLGSQAYGMATPDSDYDRQGIFVASRKRLTGLTQQKETVCVTDPDFTFHEVGKFMRLALKCNPTILEQLYVEDPEVCTHSGSLLRSYAEIFLSRDRVLGAFGGYAMEQIKRLQRRGDGTFSSDTQHRREKHARHCFRLLWQGKQLLEDGHLTVRVHPDKVAQLFEVGRMNDQDLVMAFEQEDALFKASYEKSTLPEKPDFARAEGILTRIRDIADAELA